MEKIVGPTKIITLTCKGCPALKTEQWTEYLENDEEDWGTRAWCGALNDKWITSYWDSTARVPEWCPASQEKEEL